jgi:hypothetical protein
VWKSVGAVREPPQQTIEMANLHTGLQLHTVLAAGGKLLVARAAEGIRHREAAHVRVGADEALASVMDVRRSAAAFPAQSISKP